MTYHIVCIHCDQEHELDFHMLDQPMYADGFVWTHFARCPVTEKVIYAMFHKDSCNDVSKMGKLERE